MHLIFTRSVVGRQPYLLVLRLRHPGGTDSGLTPFPIPGNSSLWLVPLLPAKYQVRCFTGIIHFTLTRAGKPILQKGKVSLGLSNFWVLSQKEDSGPGLPTAWC